MKSIRIGSLMIVLVMAVLTFPASAAGTEQEGMDMMRDDFDVILEIDIQGALQIKEAKDYANPNLQTGAEQER